MPEGTVAGETLLFTSPLPSFWLVPPPPPAPTQPAAAGGEGRASNGCEAGGEGRRTGPAPRATAHAEGATPSSSTPMSSLDTTPTGAVAAAPLRSREGTGGAAMPNGSTKTFFY